MTISLFILKGQLIRRRVESEINNVITAVILDVAPVRHFKIVSNRILRVDKNI